MRQYLLSEDDWAELLPEHFSQHAHQLFVVQVLHAVEVVEVQEHDFSGVGWQEAADLLKTFSHLDDESHKYDWFNNTVLVKKKRAFAICLKSLKHVHWLKVTKNG